MQIPFMPFKVLALAPFNTRITNPWTHPPIPVDKSNIDQIMADLGLSIEISIPKHLCPSGSLIVHFHRLKDFQPDRLLEETPFLKNILEARRFVEESKKGGLSETEVYHRLKEWPDFPFQIMYEPSKPKTASPSSRVIDDILKMVAVPEEDSSSPEETQSFMIQIDSILRQILRIIFSNEEFRNLESTWQGLRFFIKEGGADEELKLEIVPTSLDTLEETLDHLTVDLIENLPSLLLIDLPFDNSPRSLDLLEKIAHFSETLMVPSICWITPKFFYIDTWQDLKKLAYLPHVLEESNFAKWRHLSKTPAARWMAMTCNRFLSRYPYGPDNKPKWIYFEESENLWLSPVWAIGSLIGKSFHKTGWSTRFTEWQTIRLENLALNTIKEENIPTETLLSDDRIDQLIRGGIIPLVSFPNKDSAFIPLEVNVAGSSLSYQLFLSRIAQFLFWCKDHLERDLAPDLLEANLRKAFTLFWERSGHLTPKEFQISVSQPKPNQPATIRISVEPSHQILHSGERVEFELSW